MVDPDPIFADPRLAAIYDALDADRSDLDVYADLVDELGATEVLDIGCGTGTFACLLAEQGCDAVGVDPARAMLAVAQRKTQSDLIRWVHGVATDLPAMRVDLATMTGNVAQVFLGDGEWAKTLGAVRRVLGPGGHLVFESRRPERKAWLEWNRDDSIERLRIDGLGEVETWKEVIAATLPFVTFRTTVTFLSDGSELVSHSTLRFRSRDEIVDSLAATGFQVDEVREAPDRPGKELVFFASALERAMVGDDRP